MNSGFENMRILVHDYSGHPFQLQLSGQLAANGHEVMHVYSASFQTPHGNVTSQDNTAQIQIKGLKLKEQFAKHKFVKRRKQEIEFGHLVALEISKFLPEIVISSNAPLDTQKIISKTCKNLNIKFIFWVQDIYSEAIGKILTKKIPVFGYLIGQFYFHLEKKLLHQADHIVVISQSFKTLLEDKFKIQKHKISVIENWAPLNELPFIKPKQDKENNIPRFIYSGTLGYKHNPALLLALAKNLPIQIDVYSEGDGANWLIDQAKIDQIKNIAIHNWVEFDELAEVLSKGDVLLAMIEKEAGNYCVPSKVLTYMALGRPILAAIPNGNLAGEIINQNFAGYVVEPDDETGFIENAKNLIQQASVRDEMGHNGRKYAETTFDITEITQKFEKIFCAALEPEINEQLKDKCVTSAFNLSTQTSVQA